MPGFLVASQRPDGVDIVHLLDGNVRLLGTIPVADAQYIVAHPERPVAHVSSAGDGGTITTLNVRSGQVRQVSGVGESPCYLHLVDDDHLVCANYGSGTVSSIRLAEDEVDKVASTLELPNTPQPGGKKDRQTGSHPHSIQSWDDQLLVADLGTDAIHHVKFEGGELSLGDRFTELPAGAGPRHVEPGKQGELWVTRELDNGVSLVTADGVSTVSATMNGFDNHVGDIVAHEPSGTVAVANRDVNTFAVFRYATLGIERVAEISCGGEWPTQLATDGDRLAVANRDSDAVAIFEGEEYWKPKPVIIDVARPISVCRAPQWVSELG